MATDNVRKLNIDGVPQGDSLVRLEVKIKSTTYTQITIVTRTGNVLKTKKWKTDVTRMYKEYIDL